MENIREDDCARNGVRRCKHVESDDAGRTWDGVDEERGKKASERLLVGVDGRRVGS